MHRIREMPRWHPRTRSTNGPVPVSDMAAVLFSRVPRPRALSAYAPPAYVRSPLAVSFDSMVKMAS